MKALIEKKKNAEELEKEKQEKDALKKKKVREKVLASLGATEHEPA